MRSSILKSAQITFGANLNATSYLPFTLFSDEDLKEVLDFNCQLPVNEITKITLSRLILLIRLNESFRQRRIDADNILEHSDDWSLHGNCPPDASALLRAAYIDFAQGTPPFIATSTTLRPPKPEPAVAKSEINLKVKIERVTEVEEGKDLVLPKRHRTSVLSRRSLMKANEGDNAPHGASIINPPDIDRDEWSKKPRLSVSNASGLTSTLTEELLSHWILRIAFAGNRNKEDWLLEQECRLMSLRLCAWSQAAHTNSSYLGGKTALTWDEEAKSLICGLGLPYSITQVNETLNHEDPSQLELGAHVIETSICPEVSQLMKRRRCSMIRGKVYIPLREHLDKLVIGRLRQALRGLMAETGNLATRIETIVRSTELRLLVERLKSVDPGTAARANIAVASERPERLSPVNFAACLQQSFPLCMLNAQLGLKAHGHLRHHGRLQLWTFLKDAGLTCEEQIGILRALWRDADKFNKEHIYTVRHLHGLEGKREARSGYTCARILGPQTPTPKNGEFHGCPYRDFTVDAMKDFLKRIKLPELDIEEIVEKKRGHEYEMACRLVFEKLHPDEDSGEIGLTPLAYFDASRRYYMRMSGRSRPAP